MKKLFSKSNKEQAADSQPSSSASKSTYTISHQQYTIEETIAEGMLSIIIVIVHTCRHVFTVGLSIKCWIVTSMSDNI